MYQEESHWAFFDKIYLESLPAKSLMTWKLMHNVIVIEDNLVWRRMHIWFKVLSLQSSRGNCRPLISYMQVHLTFMALDGAVIWHEYL